MLKETCRFIAAGLGSGWLPKAPGTWGSLAALIAAILLLNFCNTVQFWVATLLLTLVGCAVCNVAVDNTSESDPGWIVIDEWAGQWLSLAIVITATGHTGSLSSSSLPFFIGAFTLFRLFDIWKPWPISTAERWSPEWWAVMADDLVAGFMAGVILSAILLTMGFSTYDGAVKSP